MDKEKETRFEAVDDTRFKVSWLEVLIFLVVIFAISS